MCRQIVFFMRKGPQQRRMTPLGPRPHGVDPKRKKYNFFPIGSLVPCDTGEGLSWGLKAYRENYCVFRVKNQDILEKKLKTTLSENQNIFKVVSGYGLGDRG